GSLAGRPEGVNSLRPLAPSFRSTSTSTSTTSKSTDLDRCAAPQLPPRRKRAGPEDARARPANGMIGHPWAEAVCEATDGQRPDSEASRSVGSRGAHQPSDGACRTITGSRCTVCRRGLRPASGEGALTSMAHSAGHGRAVGSEQDCAATSSSSLQLAPCWGPAPADRTDCDRFTRRPRPRPRSRADQCGTLRQRPPYW
ncbi:unnamed protein product, partial [Prorocentrum cordatum]